MLELRKRPKNKALLFKELLASTLIEDRDGFLHGESLIWKIRECSSGLMFQFSDGVINTLRLEESGAFWVPNEQQTSVVSDPIEFKHYIKRKVVLCCYKKVGKINEIKT